MKHSKAFALMIGLSIFATDFQAANATYIKRVQPIDVEGTVQNIHHKKIIGAVIAGAIIGGAIAHSRQRRYRSSHSRRYHSNRRYHKRRHYRRVYSRGDAHVGWCYRRYRSYREYDNTFQPYHGRRRECVSPYY